MKCTDCRYRNSEGTLDYCPRFGLRYLNGAIIGLKGGAIDIIECEQGSAAMKREISFIHKTLNPPYFSLAHVSSAALA